MAFQPRRHSPESCRPVLRRSEGRGASGEAFVTRARYEDPLAGAAGHLTARSKVTGRSDRTQGNGSSEGRLIAHQTAARRAPQRANITPGQNSKRSAQRRPGAKASATEPERDETSTAPARRAARHSGRPGRRRIGASTLDQRKLLAHLEQGSLAKPARQTRFRSIFQRDGYEVSQDEAGVGSSNSPERGGKRTS
jgi:hypothetical protein